MSELKTYNREFALKCYHDAKFLKKKGEHKEAAIKLKEGIANLKRNPEHRAAKLKLSAAYENRGDDLFKKETFYGAYKDYKLAFHKLNGDPRQLRILAGCFTDLLIGIFSIALA